MKTNEELNALKEEVETVSGKLHELTDGELTQVVGGGHAGRDFSLQPCSQGDYVRVDLATCFYGPSGPCKHLCINGNVGTCGEDASKGSLTLPSNIPRGVSLPDSNMI